MMKSGKVDFVMIGKRIQAQRNKLSITQDKLCTDLGLSVFYLSKIENGHVNVTLETLAEIASYLKVDLAYIISGYTPSSSNDFFVNDDLNCMAGLMALCTQKQRKLLLDIARVIIQNQ